ncbi:MAG TPA: hydroxyacid dehydrogenase [Magnetospirillaceae bacterium]|jgi:D-3-phosphoglycerate dehydrogenase
MPHVLIAGKIHPDGLALLRARPALTVEEMTDLSAEAFIARLPDADALLIRTAPLPAAAVEKAKRLRVVSRHGVGYDNVPLATLTAHGIPVTVIGNAGSVAVAEHTLMLMLTLCKEMARFDQAVRAGDWAFRNRLNPGDLENRTLLLLGLGRIGREVVKRAAAFDMRILGYDPALPEAEIAKLGVTPVRDWRAVLPQADFVSLHVPRSTETEHMIAAAELAAMKPTAYLINVARGGLVDEHALAEALAAGRIAGAGIDVLEDEPPAADHPLLKADRLILSPHVAGLSENAALRLSMAAAANVLAGLDGTLDPHFVINAEVLKR